MTPYLEKKKVKKTKKQIQGEVTYRTIINRNTLISTYIYGIH